MSDPRFEAYSRIIAYKDETIRSAQGRADAAESERDRLREAMEKVCNKYGDKGWAKTQMCIDLRAALEREN